MRIGIDLFPLVPGTGRGGGFHRYVTGLVNGLADLGSGDEYVLFTNALNAAMFPRGGAFTQVVIPLPPRRALWPFRLAAQHAVLPLMVPRQRLDLVHFPMDTAAFRLGVPYVVTTNDLIADVYYPKYFPDSISRLKARYLFAAKGRSARRAARVICPSRATAAQVHTCYNVPPERIAVVPDAVDRHLFGCDEPATPVDPPYVLSVISLSPHKNIEAMIEAFTRARVRSRLPHELHLIGMAGTDPSPVTAAIERAVGAGVPVRYLGVVTDDVLAAAYRGASLFVFLSKIEGFGLPPLEAMAGGIPVVASNTSSIPEVCGEAACLVSPDDVEGAAAAIAEILTSAETAGRLARAGRERAKLFSWTETARTTRAIYAQALADAAISGA
jgi:glycosyltransferase involved in cell wall biosynthesis